MIPTPPRLVAAATIELVYAARDRSSCTVTSPICTAAITAKIPTIKVTSVTITNTIITMICIKLPLESSVLLSNIKYLISFFRCASYKMDIRQQKHYGRLLDLVNKNKGEVISEKYTNMETKMVFKCQCNNVWEASPGKILTGRWCPKCSRKEAQRKSLEKGETSFIQKVTEREGIVIGNYIGTHNNILIQCKFGHQWEPRPNNIKSGKWCPACSYKTANGGSTKFLEILENRKGKLIGEYINSSTKTSIQCNKGHIWQTTPHQIVIGTWCRFCSGSSGENMVELYLLEK